MILSRWSYSRSSTVCRVFSLNEHCEPFLILGILLLEGVTMNLSEISGRALFR